MICLGALGDCVLAAQLALRLRGLAAATGAPAPPMTLIASTPLGDFGDATPPIAQARPERAGLGSLFEAGDGPPTVLADLIGSAVVVSALGEPSTPAQARLATLGPAVMHAFNPAVSPQSGQHVLDQWVGRLGLKGEAVRGAADDLACVEVGEDTRRRGAALVAANGVRPVADPRKYCPLVLLQVGSGGDRKCWPLGAYLELAELLRSEGARAAALVGPVERERWPQRDLDALAAAVPVLAPRSADELLAALAAATVVIGNDSGPMHLAALIGVQTLTLFGPTRAAVWRPVASASLALQGDPPAGPRWGLTPHDVLAAWRGLREPRRDPNVV